MNIPLAHLLVADTLKTRVKSVHPSNGSEIRKLCEGASQESDGAK